jgi:Flp pilus assembly pilin Flp
MKEGIGMSWIELGWLVAGRLQTRWQRLHAGSAGQSTVEYALVGALVVIAAAGALSLLGGELTTVFTQITNTLRGSAGAH